MQCLQMKAIQGCVLVLMLISTCLLCCSKGKCIFDEVQSSVKVVTPHFSQMNSSDLALQKEHKTSIISTKDKALMSLKSTLTYQAHYKSQRSKTTENFKNIASVKPQPIRIKTWTPRESPVLSQWETERLEAAVSKATSTLSKLLSVTRPPDRLLLNRDLNKYCKFIWKNTSSTNYRRCGRANENYKTEQCLGVTIPDDHLRGYFVHPHPDLPVLKVLKPDGAGVPDTDFLLYVHAQNTDKCKADSSILAYSTHCQTDSDRRPVAGVMVICREPLSMEGFSHEHMVQMVIHELLHMLGFSKDLFSTWKDLSVSQMDVESCSNGQVTNTDEAGQMRLYSPHVIKALQIHLNSTETEMGAPLENKDAGPHGVSSHWEARVLQGSIMTAELAEPSLVRIDPITLAALQDTGWYSVNLDQAQSLLWGENEGAQFGAFLTCNMSSSFFCIGSGSGCHYLHLHKGECQSDQYLDGCRIYKPLSNARACWSAEDGKSAEEEWSGEIFRSDSRCFFSSLNKENYTSSSDSVTGRCYRHRCTRRNRYQIQVLGSEWLDCPSGKSIEVSGYRGEVFCPNKRLCYYKDVAPPTSTNKLFPPPFHPTPPLFRGRNHSLMQKATTSQRSLNFDSDLPSVAMMSITAALSLLAAVTAFYMKCCSGRIRVHAAIETSDVLHLQPITRHQRQC